MRFLLILLVLFFTVTSCIQEEAGCVNITDCPAGHTCEDGVCVPSESWDGTSSHNDSSTMPDTSSGNDSALVNDGNTEDNGTTDEDSNLPPQDEDNAGTDSQNNDEAPDEVPDDITDCDPGWHLEDEGDDENGSGTRDCAENVICNDYPCHQNGKCEETEWSATCDCYEGYDGRWCDECAAGYLLSTVDSKCKADCTTGNYGCTGSKECEVDPTTNEAGCACKENYSGTDCTICDPSVFCNSHGSCSAVTGSPVCTCDEAWSGDATCTSCGDGYLQDGTNCIEGCTNYCGYSMGIVTDGLVLADSNGSCQIVSGSAECVCDAGWKTIITYNLGGQIKPPCSDCDEDNPPTGGCPE